MRKTGSFVGLALAVGLVLGSQIFSPFSSGQAPVKPAPIRTAPPQVEPISYRDIVKKVLPAVVSIESKAKVARLAAPKGKRPALPDDLPEEFRKFFEDFRKNPEGFSEQPRLGFGSGFLVDPKGIVLTNFHVVDGAESVVVTLHDGRKVTSKEIQGDRRTDLAIVRLPASATPYPYLELGDSDEAEIGDRVLAVGAPFGLTGSVTHGIISAKGRTGLNLNMYEDFIQTDAPINPGNSGGPLVGLDGKVVGVNSAIKTRSGGFQGVGLAVSSNLVKNIKKALETDGVVRRGYLGVQIRDLDPEVAQRLGLNQETGVVVSEVFNNTPAFKAGLQAGDIITQIGGKSVKDSRTLQMGVASLPIGQASEITVFRDGKPARISVTIEEQPQEFGTASVPAPRSSPHEPESISLGKLGIEIADLNDAMAEDLGYRKGTRGVVITKVEPNSPAFEAGLRRGMLVLKLENQRLQGAAEARQALENAALDRGVLLQIQSPTGGISFVVLKTA